MLNSTYLKSIGVNPAGDTGDTSPAKIGLRGTVPLKMIQALERAVTQFLKLKAEAGSDKLLIVAQSMPVSVCCGWLQGHGHLSCSRDAAAARTNMACRGDLLLQFQSGYT